MPRNTCAAMLLRTACAHLHPSHPNAGGMGGMQPQSMVGRSPCPTRCPVLTYGNDTAAYGTTLLMSYALSGTDIACGSSSSSSSRYGIPMVLRIH
eukprot:2534006-Rhodomonas_salina.1